MSDKLKDVMIDFAVALVIFAGGYYLHGVINRNVTTTIIGKTIEFTLPGRRDTVRVKVPVYIEKPSKDSTAVWKGKYDSLQALARNSDTTEQDDPFFTRHLLPFKVIVRDDWTRNHLTVFPLNTDSDRVRLDWTDYDSLTFKFNYQDTTTNIIRVEQSWYDHWEWGAGGMAALIWIISQL